MLQVQKVACSLKTVCIAFGSNQSAQPTELQQIIKSAYALVLSKYLINPLYSPFYQTPAFPAGYGPDFVNSVISAQTHLTPQSLMAVLHNAEEKLGRVRKKRWGQRTIDIDLLSYNTCILPSSEIYMSWRNMPLEKQKTTWPQGLILPHPRIQDRAFVLLPLKTVSPNWVNPVTSEHIDMLIARYNPEDLSKIREIPDV